MAFPRSGFPSCSQKRELLRSYLAQLDIVNVKTREYAEMICTGHNRDVLDPAKAGIEAARMEYRQALKRYLDDRREHAC